jgi:hypothetical protein
MSRTKNALAAIAVAGTLAVAPVAPAVAQGPVVTGGLVNVTITNLLNNNTTTVQIPVTAAANVAANVCGVTANVLATQLGSGQTVNCQNRNRAIALVPVTA